MLATYQHLPYLLKPIAFHLGALPIRWYSLMYVLASLTFLVLAYYRITHDPVKILPKADEKKQWEIIQEVFIFSFIGLVVGARLGYFFFYAWDEFLSHPFQALLPFENGQFTGYYGLSYHGGLIMSLLFGYFYCRWKKISFERLIDFVIPAIPLAYFWGRLGNFLNEEILGKTTNFFGGMYFPTADTTQLTHPVQLYEALGEGILIFLLLWPVRNKASLQGKFLALYLVLYGSIRFFLEFFRAPDSFLGPLSIGQWLCGGMVIVGVFLLISKKKS